MTNNNNQENLDEIVENDQMDIKENDECCNDLDNESCLSAEELALKSKLESCEEELLKLKDSYLRAAADFENIKKRFEREKQDAISFGNEKLLKDLLPVIDALEIAIEFEADDDFTKGIKEGMQNTLGLLLKTLAKHGILEIKAEVEDDYDYNVHEAISIVESELESNKIVQVYQKGYALNDRVIRACKVIVSK